MPAIEKVLTPVLVALAVGIVAVIITGTGHRPHQRVLAWCIRIFYFRRFRFLRSRHGRQDSITTLFDVIATGLERLAGDTVLERGRLGP